MSGGIEARFEYGGMSLICDEAAFARIREHILSEATVAEVIEDASEASGVRFISVRPPTDETALRRSGRAWLIPTILATCFSAVVTIAGLLAIIQWVMRLP
jgi:hypothetical protein